MVRKWGVTKQYHCHILGESCDEGTNDIRDKGPDCKDCEIYINWKRSLKQKQKQEG